MNYIIDRFEGDFAVCEDEAQEMVNLPRSALPEGCKEGDKLQKTEHGYVRLDNEAERAALRARLNRLFGRTD